MRRTSGFSLIEMVMILVLLGLGSVTLVSLYGHSVGSLDEDAVIQTGAQAVQQCGEHILGMRRRSTNAYTDLTAANAATYCSGLTLPSGYARSLTLTDPYAGGACPAGATCKRVQIGVTETTHGTVASGDLVLVSY